MNTEQGLSAQCPFIHPIEGVRCEKKRGHAKGDDPEHIVKAYWTGGDSLRWRNR